MSMRVLVPLAEGFEEIEAVTIIDVLRRADLEVVAAGLEGTDPVKGANGMSLVPDVALESVKDEAFDMIVLPGGMGGTQKLATDARVQALLKAQDAAERPVAAICAAPMALEPAGLTAGRSITSHPSVKSFLTAQSNYSEDRVVVDGRLVTSRGPGTSMEFALALVSMLYDEDKAKAMAEPLLAK